MSNPKGIFDRATLGLKTPPIFVDVERGQIRFFCKSIGETNPIHSKLEVAIAEGHPDIVAPVTFPIAIMMSANESLIGDGDKPGMDLINCDYRRLLHGSERYEYQGLIYGGDRLEVQTEVAGFDDKKGGLMELAFLKTTIRHKERGLLVTASSTAIHRLG